MKSIIPRTIQARLILSHLLVSIISIILISVYAGSTLYRATRAQVEHRYEDLAFAAADLLERPLLEYKINSSAQSDLTVSIAKLFRNNPEVRYTVYDSAGNAIVDSLGDLSASLQATERPDVAQVLSGDNLEGEYIGRNVQGAEVLNLAVAVTDGNEIIGAVAFQVPAENALLAARRSLAALIASALVVALAMSAVGYYLARNLAVPISGLTDTAESLARGELDARVNSPEVPVELNRLAHSFNTMAERLQAYVHELRSFVANASHELRTPLTSIKLRVESLRNGALDDPSVADRFLAEIESEVDRLSCMVNEMLDLSRIEGGLTEEQRVPVNLAQIVEEVYATFLARTQRAEIDFTRRVDPSVHPFLGDEEQLRRMLYNLVDNAIKYTPHNGQVEIVLDRVDGEQLSRLVVRDNGFGITKNQLPHIFERFYRVEATRPRYGPPQGTGLGLAITKSIVENHGGAINVSSNVGEGTTFVIDFPAGKVS